MKRGTVKNREDFLNNIANGLGRNRRSTKITRPNKEFQPQLKVLDNLTKDELVDEFKLACETIHTNVRTATGDSLLPILLDEIKTLGNGPIVTPKDHRFKSYGIEELLEREDTHVWDPLLGKEYIDYAKGSNIGITFSDITLAESGTVVLFNDKEKARSISLLPTAYIAIIPKSTIVPRLTQAAQQIRKKVLAGEAIPSCVNFISGPSNSADIEFNLVVGVHGPIKASYIIVLDR
ncbi:LutC/YkgG family protein [Virgibacillus sp. W0181]|uniref:LutC/YkgG family protein n=1 Tax=Virgibacillus sp. W0181 TaxID=3391581 RepID=UPI003F48587C